MTTRRATPALLEEGGVDRPTGHLSPEERRVWVRCLAAWALEAVLCEMAQEDAAEQQIDAARARDPAGDSGQPAARRPCPADEKQTARQALKTPPGPTRKEV